MKLDRTTHVGGIGALAVAAITAVSGAGLDPQFLGPSPYLGIADSPFPLQDIGRAWILEDFEDGVWNPSGAFFSVANPGFVAGPGPTTDSVDEDDGLVDGFGTAGHCWHSPAPPSNQVVINFNGPLLGGYPTEVGLVWTDGLVPSGVTFTVLNGNGIFVGSLVQSLGDEADGTTADDRFLGIVAPGGVGTIILQNSAGPVEFDHLQFRLPVPFRADFLGPTPYLQFEDSPFFGTGVFVVQDFEDGTTDTLGATITGGTLNSPGGSTDSVDGDDGVIDGSGTNGWSLAVASGAKVDVAFDEARLGGLPTRFGVTVTDTSSGPRTFRLRGFDASDVSVGFHDFVVTGDASGEGTTAEDRFLGFESDVGLSRVEIWALNAPGELDHLQFDRPVVNQLTKVGPAPYLSVSDSPFDIDGNPSGFAVADAESGTASAYGATIDVSLVIAPAFYTDSVDGDDGNIDGSGAEGYSMAQLAGAPVMVAFDAAVLGGLPTKFGVVLTDCCSGPQTFRLRAFDADDFPLGEIEQEIVFDDTLFATTAEDRFLGFSSAVGMARVEIEGPDLCNFELDHIQYDLSTPNALTAIAPTPYLSVADSPFDIDANPNGFVVIDAEDGQASGLGATVDVSLIITPAVYTDSVDGDDGNIDGSGAAGTSMAQFAGAPVVVTFDGDLLGGLPTQFGVVLTDTCSGTWSFQLRAFDANDQPLGLVEQAISFDETQFGTTAEDRFIGFTSTTGFARVEILGPAVCNFELDHIQYNVAAPSVLKAIAPVPYLSEADSPFDIDANPDGFVVVNAENGVIESFGATVDVSLLIAPAFYTDSVDGDDGNIDGSGAEGFSMAQLAGSPVVVTFDAQALNGLPTRFGVVITDSCGGVWPFELRAFDADDQPLGLVQQSLFLDDTQFGTTGEDRFIGFTSPVGLGRVEIWGPDVCNFELDHIQYDLPKPETVEGDLNGDGVVDGGDLGSLLAAWGTPGPGDLNGDGTVDGADLGTLLALWTT